LACAALPCGDDGGITLLEREGPRTAVATSETALEVDNAQYDTEQGGPCLEAYQQQQQIFRIESTADEARWPEFSRSAAAAGINSTLSLPLVVGGDGIGALNIYCRQTGGFSETERGTRRLVRQHDNMVPEVLISSGAGWSGRDALNLAAMTTWRSFAAMSAVDRGFSSCTRGRGALAFAVHDRPSLSCAQGWAVSWRWQ
jgi:hypothetical protein